MISTEYVAISSFPWNFGLIAFFYSSKYCATLGHKANHSFSANAEWSLFEHPRFGLIRALASLRDVKSGEEILVNYNLALNRLIFAPQLFWILSKLPPRSGLPNGISVCG
jgi:hypothetical protein